MASEVQSLTRAVELVAAGSWAIDSALRCLESGDMQRARSILEHAQETVREGLAELSEVLDASVKEALERPERLARALASLQELSELAPSRPED